MFHLSYINNEIQLIFSSYCVFVEKYANAFLKIRGTRSCQNDIFNDIHAKAILGASWRSSTEKDFMSFRGGYPVMHGLPSCICNMLLLFNTTRIISTKDLTLW